MKRIPFRLTMLALGLVLLALFHAGLVTGQEAGLISAAGLGGMLMDERLEFADATALNTGGAGVYLVGDVIDLDPASTAPNATVDLEGSELYLIIQVDTTATSGGSATAAFTLASDAQAAIATDGSASSHINIGAIPVATLVAGYRIAAMRLPSGVYERYLGILQTTAVAAFTAGKINAFLTRDPALYRAYADNVA
jgi:hypothetical protein